MRRTSSRTASPGNETPCFPQEFVWGAATSSYQIEGAFCEDGKGLSIWDDFCRKDGAIHNGESANHTCDHYHRFADDVGIMRELSLRAYRFSVSWPRVIPEGGGQVNPSGLAFYDALVDKLLEAHIEPWVTLFHWDYPLALQQRGGWLNPESPYWFEAYVRQVVDRLSDRVQHWFTINEPQVFINYGHDKGTNAPGLRLGIDEQLLACHHVLLAHGLAVRAIRESSRNPSVVGWAPVGDVMVPETADESDIEAARSATMGIRSDTTWNNIWYNDPIFFGEYPEEGLRAYGKAVPNWTAEEMDVVSTPIDFLGLNIYTAKQVRSDATERYREVSFQPGVPHTAMNWPMVEESLYWGPKFHWDRYKTPIYITENGMANNDWVNTEGNVLDPQRIDFTRRYLLQLHRCFGEQIDVRGYFHWSLMDNFEWAEGFSKRFGLVYVDFQTQSRVKKQSAYWYRDVIDSNGQSLLATPG